MSNEGETLRREVEVDTKLAELWNAADKLRDRMHSTKVSIARAVGIKPYYQGGRYVVTNTVAELLELAVAKLANLDDRPWDQRHLQETVDKYAALKAELDANQIEASPLEQEYDNAQWSRFFLVQNANGHIHSSMNCSSCNMRTRFGWLPTLSGLTEKDAVEEHGPRLCSICYPSAPVEWTLGLPKNDENTCPGSGKVVEGVRRYRECPDCHKVINVLSGGRLRKHKKGA